MLTEAKRWHKHNADTSKTLTEAYCLQKHNTDRGIVL